MTSSSRHHSNGVDSYDFFHLSGSGPRARVGQDETDFSAPTPLERRRHRSREKKSQGFSDTHMYVETERPALHTLAYSRQRHPYPIVSPSTARSTTQSPAGAAEDDGFLGIVYSDPVTEASSVMTGMSQQELIRKKVRETKKKQKYSSSKRKKKKKPVIQILPSMLGSSTASTNNTRSSPARGATTTTTTMERASAVGVVEEKQQQQQQRNRRAMVSDASKWKALQPVNDDVEHSTAESTQTENSFSKSGLQQQQQQQQQPRSTVRDLFGPSGPYSSTLDQDQQSLGEDSFPLLSRNATNGDDIFVEPPAAAAVVTPPRPSPPGKRARAVRFAPQIVAPSAVTMLGRQGNSNAATDPPPSILRATPRFAATKFRSWRSPRPAVALSPPRDGFDFVDQEGQVVSPIRNGSAVTKESTLHWLGHPAERGLVAAAQQQQQQQQSKLPMTAPAEDVPSEENYPDPPLELNIDDESTVVSLPRNNFLEAVAAIVVQTAFRRYLAMKYVDDLKEMIAEEMHAEYLRQRQAWEEQQRLLQKQEDSVRQRLAREQEEQVNTSFHSAGSQEQENGNSGPLASRHQEILQQREQPEQVDTHTLSASLQEREDRTSGGAVLPQQEQQQVNTSFPSAGSQEQEKGNSGPLTSRLQEEWQQRQQQAQVDTSTLPASLQEREERTGGGPVRPQQKQQQVNTTIPSAGSQEQENQNSGPLVSGQPEEWKRQQQQEEVNTSFHSASSKNPQHRNSEPMVSQLPEDWERKRQQKQVNTSFHSASSQEREHRNSEQEVSQEPQAFEHQPEQERVNTSFHSAASHEREKQTIGRLDPQQPEEWERQSQQEQVNTSFHSVSSQEQQRRINGSLVSPETQEFEHLPQQEKVNTSFHSAATQERGNRSSEPLASPSRDDVSGEAHIFLGRGERREHPTTPPVHSLSPSSRVIAHTTPTISPEHASQGTPVSASRDLEGRLAQHEPRPQRDRALVVYTLAAIRIQAAFRGFWARDSLDVDHYCATLIQKSGRRYLCRKRFQFTIACVVKAQSIWRRSLTREHVATTLGAVVFIQSIARGFLVRKRASKGKVALVPATTRKHSGGKSWQQDMVIPAFRARQIGQLGYTTPHPSRIRPKTTATDSRSPVTREDWAALRIQSRFRSYACEMSFIRSLVDILIVQTVVRRWLAKRRAVRVRVHRRGNTSTKRLKTERSSRKN